MTHSRYFVVHSSSCTRCEQIAQEVERISGGTLAAIQQTDTIVDTATRRLSTRVPVGEPYILAQHDDGGFKVIQGSAMSRFVIRRLGLRRSLQIARLLAPTRFQPSRRGLLRGAVASTVVAVGWAVGAPTLAAADTGDVLTQDDARRRFENLSSNPGIAAALAEIEAAGYDLSEVDHCGARLDDGTVFVFATFASKSDPNNDAALLLTRQDGRRTLESHWGQLPRPQEDPQQQPASGTVPASLQLTSPLVMSEPPQVQPAGLKEFLACFAGLAGTDCGKAVAECTKYGPPTWSPVIGCVIGACGAGAAAAAWDCKGALTK